MAYIATDTTMVLSWAADHLNLIGWPIFLGIIWRVRGALDDYFNDQKIAVDKVSKTLDSVEDAKKVAVEAVKTATEHGAQRAQELIDRVEANQKRIEETAAAVKKIDENDLAHLTDGLKAKWTEQGEATRGTLLVLQSIDKNIAVLVDRSAPPVARRRSSK